MKFKPLSEKELQEQSGTLAAGRGEFEILDCEETKSKSTGNDMLKITLKAWDKDGREGRIFDYIVATAQWKLKALLDSVGMSESYDNGNVNAIELVGRCGRIDIGIQKDPEHGDKPKVKNYLLAQASQEKKSSTQSDEPPDFNIDDII